VHSRVKQVNRKGCMMGAFASARSFVKHHFVRYLEAAALKSEPRPVK
jgi:hypothetical protein